MYSRFYPQKIFGPDIFVGFLLVLASVSVVKRKRKRKTIAGFWGEKV